ncbi:unnamed protein product [Lymnaea stagnalis]|uniref:Uncharacterized protein n=1 Tax=Lymnaea stagnalis TaxID=6523 RepID=A0AAV2I0K1_LYMST
MKHDTLRKQIKGLVITFLAISLSSHVVLARSSSLECNPIQVKMTCLLGCFACFQAYGVELYDMAACCRDCRLTNADVIDEGPSRCSRDYIRKSWLKRIG